MRARQLITSASPGKMWTPCPSLSQTAGSPRETSASSCMTRLMPTLPPLRLQPPLRLKPPGWAPIGNSVMGGPASSDCSDTTFEGASDAARDAPAPCWIALASISEKSLPASARG
eukprot:4820616-Prymnesium_polylepis.1